EFIYFQSLIDKDVSIRRNFRKHWKNGLRYLGFNFVMLLLAIGLIIGGVALAMASPLLIIPLILAGLSLLLVIGVFMTAIHDFVLPEMIVEEQKFIESMRTVFPRLKDSWKQFAVYYIARLVLGGIKAFYSITVLVILGVLLAVPFALLGIMLTMFAPVLLLLAVIPGLITWAVLYLYIAEVPAETYLYFYALENYKRI
ncbi:MAG: hypothetical protein ABEJ72_07020, partial [Candidatus Aenigmatarchaeota archaeon]